MQYTTMAALGIDPTTLEFEPMPETAGASGGPPPPRTVKAGLTIAEAKRGLAQTFGVTEDAIEIVIRG